LKLVEKVSTIKAKGIEITKQNFSDPTMVELYNEKEQIGYFLYARIEEVRSTDKTLVKFNSFIGNQTQNTWELNKFIGLRVYYKIKSYLLNITTTLELLRYDQEMRGWL
jgi:5-formaminoimidazole-4-carboxamide-1-beta-D-ribofuranosyl 5'-monophosphate synthetase